MGATCGTHAFAAARFVTAAGGLGVAVAVGVDVGVEVAVGVGVGGIAYSVSPVVFPLTVAYSSQSQHVPDFPGLLMIQ